MALKIFKTDDVSRKGAENKQMQIRCNVATSLALLCPRKPDFLALYLESCVAL